MEKRPLGRQGKRGLAQLGGVEASRFALSWLNVVGSKNRLNIVGPHTTRSGDGISVRGGAKERTTSEREEVSGREEGELQTKP